jgi:hypothetical protein
MSHFPVSHYSCNYQPFTTTHIEAADRIPHKRAGLGNFLRVTLPFTVDGSPCATPQDTYLFVRHSSDSLCPLGQLHVGYRHVQKVCRLAPPLFFAAVRRSSM